MDGSLRLPGGRELEVQPLGAGELIGEMAVLSRGPGAISVRASELSTGWSFAAVDVGRLGAADQPEVMRGSAGCALGRLREQYERLGELCDTDPRAGGPARPAELDDAGPVGPVERERGRDRLPGDGAVLQQLQPPPRSRSCSATCADWRHRAGHGIGPADGCSLLVFSRGASRPRSAAAASRRGPARRARAASSVT